MLTSESIRKDEVMVLAVGNGGCMATQSIFDRKFSCLFCNSAQNDLKSLAVTVENKYKLHYTNPDGMGTDGAGCNRALGKKMAEDNISRIFKRIDTDYNGSKFIYVAFSLAGGTGSGGATTIIKALHERYGHDRAGKDQEIIPRPDRYVGAIIIIPSNKDGVTLEGYNNAIECYAEVEMLVKQGVLKSVFICDNSVSDKWTVNEEIGRDFEDLFTIPERTTATGQSIDGGDLIRALKHSGWVHSSTFTLPVKNDTDITNIIPNNYMPEFRKTGCQALIATVNMEEDDTSSYENIKRYYTPPKDFGKMGTVLNGMEEEAMGITMNRAFAFGINMPQQVKKNLEELYNKEVQEINTSIQPEEEYTVNLQEVKIGSAKKVEVEEYKPVLQQINKPTQEQRPQRPLSQREMLLARLKSGKQ